MSWCVTVFTVLLRARIRIGIYRVIQNDCRGFDNLSYTVLLR